MPGLHPSGRSAFVLLIIVFAVASASPSRPGLAGTFDKISSEVRQPSTGSGGAPAGNASSSKREKKSRDQHVHHSDYCEDDDDTDNAIAKFLAAGVLVGVTSPFWGPHEALEDDLSYNGYFPEHPYDKAEGSLLFDKSPRGAHDSLIVLQGQYGENFDDIFHANGRVLMENSSRFGFDTEFFYRNEDVQTGHDELWTGD